MIKAIGRVLLSLSIIAGVSLPIAPGVISVANANDLPGLTPTFGARVADGYAGGFKYQVSNYDAAYTWTVSATVGTAAISSSGLVSVTGVGAKLSSTLTVNTSRTGYTSGTASVTSVGPWNLSEEIQLQNITASLSGTTLTVNVPDAKGWRWSLIWSGAVQATNITSFPYTVNNFSSNREIQLGAVDSLDNYGYSRVFLPTVVPSAPVNLPGLTPTFGPRVPDYYAPGFKHQISNYDPAYTWTVSSTVGTATISSTGLVSVAGVGAKVSATVTVTTNRTGYNSANASVTSLGPWNLSEEIQLQNITATLSGTTLTVNVPDSKGWTWTLAWDNQSKFTNLTFPYTVPNFPANKQIQLYAEDNLVNYGYSRLITPTVAALLSQAPLTTSVSTPLRVGSTANLSTSGGNGTGSITYSSLTTSTCTVSGSIVTARAAGTCTIMTIKAADSTYAAANLGTNFAVTSATLLTQASVTMATFPTSNLAVNATSNFQVTGGSGTGAFSFSSITPSICSVVNTQVQGVSPGTCIIGIVKAGDATYLPLNATYSFSIGKMAQTPLSFTMPASIRVGSSIQLSATGGSGTGFLSFVTTTSTICSVSGSTLTGIAAGTCRVTLVKNEDTNYLSATTALSVTVTAASLLNQTSLVFTSIPAGLGVATSGNFQVSGGSGTGALTYSTTTPSICSVSGTQVTGVAAGTCTLVATKAADTAYLVATTSINLTIGKAAQASLSFAPTSNVKFGATLSLFAGGGSGTGAITFTTSTPSVCSVSGTTLTTLIAGTCTLTATKASDANYQIASVTTSINVQGLQNQDPLIMAIPGLPSGPINVGGFYGVTITGGTGTGAISYSTSTPTVCALSGTANPSMFPFQIQGVAPGNCSVTVRKAADSRYLERVITGNYTVASVLKNQSTINVEQIEPLTVGGSAVINASGGSGTGAFVYTSITPGVCLTSGSTIYSKAPGTCTISVRKDADSEFLVNTVAYSFTIRAGKPTVSFSPAMTAGQALVGSFYVSANGSTGSGSQGRIAQVCLTIDGSAITSGEVSNSNGYYWSNGYSSSSNCFNVSTSYYSNNSYRWLLESRNYEPGAHIFGITVIDTEGNRSDSASISLILKSTKPTIQILSPSMGSVAKGKVNVSFSVTTSQEAGRYIRYIGISEENAVPTFSGAYGTWSTPFSSGIKAFSVGSSSSSGTFSFQVNTQKLQKGLRTIKVAVQDSNGDIVEATVGVDVQALQPRVQILSPSSGQTFEGVVTIKVQASPDPSSTGGEISYIGIDNSQLTPEFAGVEQNSSSAGFPSNYRTWQVNDVRTFSFTAKPGSLKNGLIRLTVLIADDTKASATASVDFTVSTANPTAVITSPVAGTITPGVITLTAETKPNPISGGRIVAIAISEKNAQPTFYGTPAYNSSNENISRNYSVWTVDDVQKPSWKIDLTNWEPGDHIITVITQDSYGKVGQGTLVLNVPPKAVFISTLAGPPVLGRSVPISVEMRTNSPYRSAPAVIVTLQSSPTEAGPWKDLGDITLDGTGKGSGSVVVTAKLWVRALHKQLDAVQPGVGAPLRIVNVPDPNRTNTTSGDVNPDGSTPKVTCVPKANTKAGKSVSISCSQIDVQDPSQQMTLFVQQKNKFVKANSAMFKDGFIMSNYTSKSKGKLTFQVRGLAPDDSKYVAWKSNMFTITWS